MVTLYFMMLHLACDPNGIEVPPRSCQKIRCTEGDGGIVCTLATLP
jgi:hypothetical protein